MLSSNVNSAITAYVSTALIIAMLTGTVFGETDGDVKKESPMTESEFRSQFKIAAAKFKRNFENVECRVECQYQLDDPNDLSRKKKYDYTAHLIRKGDSAVSVQNYSKETLYRGTDSKKVACATPNYAFELYKTKANMPYLLRFTNHPSTQAERWRMRIVMGNGLDLLLCAASHTYDGPFDVILEKPTFNIVKLERLSSNEGEELVALDFRLTNDPWFISGGRIVFLPRLNWAVHEYQYRRDYTDTSYSIISGKNTFSSVQKHAIPLPDKCEHQLIHYHAGVPPIIEKYSAILTDYSIGTVDDSMFRLSHYGLPDAPLAVPTFSIKKIIQWFLIGNGILLFLIIMGMIIKRVRDIRTPGEQR